MSDGERERVGRSEHEQVLDVMRQMDPAVVRAALDKVQKEKAVDPTVGIFTAKFPKHSAEYERQRYYLWAARILPQTGEGVQPWVTPHRHGKGPEWYRALSGEIQMNIGTVEPYGDPRRETVVYRPPIAFHPGDEITIEENEVHSALNPWKGEEGVDPMGDFLFMCPDEHMVDRNEAHPEGDREVVTHIAGSIPSHYPQRA